MNYYTAYGLTFASEIEFDEMISIEPCEADIKIQIGACPQSIENITGSTPIFAVNDHELLMRIHSVANYYVRDDSVITIERIDEYDWRAIRSYLLGSLLGNILARRGFVPFHASAILMDGKAVLFSGTGGSGKSTIAAKFSKHGYPILNDDICTIDLRSGSPVVQPGLAQIKLWSDALNAIGDDDPAELRQLVQKTDKFAKPIWDSFHNGAVPLSNIFFIGTTRGSDEIIYDQIKGGAKFFRMKKNLYISKAQDGLINSPEMLQKLSLIAQKAGCYSIVRDRLSDDREGVYERVMEILAR